MMAVKPKIRFRGSELDMSPLDCLVCIDNLACDEVRNWLDFINMKALHTYILVWLPDRKSVV